jgi:predicted RNase H-like HicB family nuclease/predicted RNA binding protein YcfA (HicA-like mRNA interferase family)
MIALLESHGWYLARTKGSHRQFKHPTQPGTVTVAGKPSVELPAGTPEQHLEAGRPEVICSTWMELMQYAIVIGRSSNGFGAYVPDLPGCVAVAESEHEVRDLIREAIEFHLEGLREDNDLFPEPAARVEYVEVLHAALEEALEMNRA